MVEILIEYVAKQNKMLHPKIFFMILFPWVERTTSCFETIHSKNNKNQNAIDS